MDRALYLDPTAYPKPHAIEDPTLKKATVTIGPYLKAYSVDATYYDFAAEATNSVRNE